MEEPWVQPEDFEPWWDVVPEFVELRKDGEITLAAVTMDESPVDEFPDLTFTVNGEAVSKWDYDFIRSVF